MWWWTSLATEYKMCLIYGIYLWFFGKFCGTRMLFLFLGYHPTRSNSNHDIDKVYEKDKNL